MQIGKKCEVLLTRKAWLETTAEACFVSVGRVDQDKVLRSDKWLSMFGRGATLDADGQHLGYGFGNGQQIGHRRERTPHEVGIETGNDHLFSTISQLSCDGSQVGTEEVRLINPDHSCPGIDAVKNLRSVLDRFGPHTRLGMADDLAVRISIV